MYCNVLLAPNRFTFRSGQMIDVDEKKDLSRNSFQIDYDRIIFSNSFRRLSKKTQVHPLSKNDHVHNRLTHSLETASVGRTLGFKSFKSFKKHKIHNCSDPSEVASLVQAACLAHDIGNPPFGHAGESVIKEWFSKHISDANSRLHSLFVELSDAERNDFKYFDGNAHSFRVVTQLENKQFKGGLQLTLPTLAAMIKYPWSSSSGENTKEKFGFFQGEKEIVDELFQFIGLKSNSDEYNRHPLSYLTEVADDICYALIDLQDAIELDILNIDDIVPIFKDLCDNYKLDTIIMDRNKTDTNKVAHMCAIAINNLTEHGLYVFEKNFVKILEDSKQVTQLSEENYQSA